MRQLFIIITSFLLLLFQSEKEEVSNAPYVYVLGVAQDAGYPQINCEKQCCKRVYENPEYRRMVSSIAIVDPISKEEWIFDATPDFSEQVKLLNDHTNRHGDLPEGVFLTHAHMGHYTGLMYLGREAMGAKNMNVFAMPRMKSYLETNGPWSQLTLLGNIALNSINNMKAVQLNERVAVTPILVPHRDEFSETVGYLINTGKKQILFVPDIDKWQLWEHSITDLIKQVDVALLDATFYKNGEINRDMSEVPHPFVEESMELFENLSKEDKAKVHFIHFNHTNPLLIDNSEAVRTVVKYGFKIAKQGAVIIP
ncbi:MBL fold metallo-hydrolase [Urechidicola vernalis]|uniref:MBL fold metallo-hydrolase n=1 Tax=Urechidicola vernalis TaxID=3075600 RepID=A0ABU2Y6U5_9FLAO|nr:MBL fold metallo-hydrolase [Urechidicola sp. P050]MDT0553412.1 MBL fold metallo-hydrolase [Urechidicola sp. P050]